MNYAIRSAIANDREALGRLRAASIRHFAADHYSPEQIRAWIANLTTDLTLDATYVAHETSDVNDIVGFSSVRLDTRPHLWALYVDPAFGSCGIGTALLQRAEEKVRDAGYDRLWIAASINAVPFYVARGYIAGEPFQLQLTRNDRIRMMAVALTKTLQR